MRHSSTSSKQQLRPLPSILFFYDPVRIRWRHDWTFAAFSPLTIGAFFHRLFFTIIDYLSDIKWVPTMVNIINDSIRMLNHFRLVFSVWWSWSRPRTWSASTWAGRSSLSWRRTLPNSPTPGSAAWWDTESHIEAQGPVVFFKIRTFRQPFLALGIAHAHIQYKMV